MVTFIPSSSFLFLGQRHKKTPTTEYSQLQFVFFNPRPETGLGAPGGLGADSTMIQAAAARARPRMGRAPARGPASVRLGGPLAAAEAPAGPRRQEAHRHGRGAE